MIRAIIFICCIQLFAIWQNTEAQNSNSEYIFNKENGRIILAYKYFEDFLISDKSWANYNKLVLNACPEMQSIHSKFLSWGVVDSLKFRDEMEKTKIENWAWCMNRYDNKMLNYLYDSIVIKANAILPPIKQQMVDLCFFIPYPGCFVMHDSIKSTICISLFIDPIDISKILTHEYAHCLHLQRHTQEPLSLKRELVSEGVAVYLTTLTINEINVSNAVPFMPETAFKWCLENENTIKDSVKVDLNNNTCDFISRYIADGEGYSKPPKGFVEKTGYFIGYQIIKACIDKGITLEEICLLSSDAVINKSGYFE